MIYETKERAERWAAELNNRKGHPRARAVLTRNGWTVIASYAFGISGQM
jgi:hypothetical protein